MDAGGPKWDQDQDLPPPPGGALTFQEKYNAVPDIY